MNGRVRAGWLVWVYLGCIFVAVPLGLPAHEQALSTMSDDQFAYYLRRLDGDGNGWRAVLTSIDTGALGADEEEQRILDRHHQVALRSLEEIQRHVQQLSVQQSLYHDILLLLELNRLENTVTLLRGALTHPRSLEKLAPGKPALWDAYAGRTVQLLKELVDDSEMLHTHVLAFAYQLDRALERGKEKSSGQENNR